MLRSTHTAATVAVPPAFYEHLVRTFTEAGHRQAISDEGIDMQGIMITCEVDDAPAPPPPPHRLYVTTYRHRDVEMRITGSYNRAAELSAIRALVAFLTDQGSTVRLDEIRHVDTPQPTPPGEWRPAYDDVSVYAWLVDRRFVAGQIWIEQVARPLPADPEQLSGLWQMRYSGTNLYIRKTDRVPAEDPDFGRKPGGWLPWMPGEFYLGSYLTYGARPIDPEVAGVPEAIQ